MSSSVDLARQLLDRAQDDVVAANALLDVAAVSDAIVGFHAQQAVAKAIKAVLTIHHVDYPFTHDLELLTALCAHAGMPVPADLVDVPRLSPYAARLRYGDVAANTVDRSTALRWSRSAVSWAIREISATAT
jgi:HEPN domain-containing protein